MKQVIKQKEKLGQKAKQGRHDQNVIKTGTKQNVSVTESLWHLRHH